MLVTQGLSRGTEGQGLAPGHGQGPGLGPGQGQELERDSEGSGEGDGGGGNFTGTSVITIANSGDGDTAGGEVVVVDDTVSPGRRADANAGMLLLFQALCESYRDTTPTPTPTTTGHRSHPTVGDGGGGGGDEGVSSDQSAVQAMAAAALIVGLPKGQFYNRPQVCKASLGDRQLAPHPLFLLPHSLIPVIPIPSPLRCTSTPTRPMPCIRSVYRRFCD